MKTDIYRASVPTACGKLGELASKQQQQYRVGRGMTWEQTSRSGGGRGRRAAAAKRQPSRPPPPRRGSARLRHALMYSHRGGATAAGLPAGKQGGVRMIAGHMLPCCMGLQLAAHLWPFFTASLKFLPAEER